MLSKIGLILVVLVFEYNCVLSSSAAPEIVLRTCKENSGALKYEVGKSYIYDYSSSVDKIVSKTSLKIKGTAILTPLSACELVLTVEDGIIVNSAAKGASPDITTKITKSSVRFVLSDGVITEIISDAGEIPWTVNFKKAIVSMIQNPTFASDKTDIMTNVETSILGNCRTNYSKSSINVYKKTVDLTECGQGEGSNLIFHGIPYMEPNAVNKNILPSKKSLHCEQTLKDGIISFVSCEEKQNLLFHSIDIQMISMLKYKKTEDKKITDKEISNLQRSSTILYDFTKSVTSEMEQISVENLKRLLSSLKSDESNKAEIFIDMKRAILRISNLRQFNPILTMNIHSKIFYDAVAEVTTDEGVGFLAELASKEELDTTTLVDLYTNMAFASMPGSKGLRALKDLVANIRIPSDLKDDSDFSEKAKNISLAQQLLLGSSGFAYQYCKVTNHDCKSVPEYTALVNAIAEQANIKGDEDILRGALHSLGNLDNLTPEAATTIINVLNQDNDDKPWIKILALDSFRRDPSQIQLCQSAQQILANNTISDDIRIHAYLALSKCELFEDENILKAILIEQPSSVGPFIATHIRNLQKSSSPSKMKLKPLFSKLSKLIPGNVKSVQDIPRATKYMEYSTFNPKDNLGISAEAVIMFTPGNPKPQFVSLAGTVDLYGRSYNLIEIGISQRLMMSTMQFYPDDAPVEWYSLQNAISSPDSYYRVLGTTVGIGLKMVFEWQKMIQTNIRNGAGAEGLNIDTIFPSTFIDAELTYPSITGLPLTFNIQAVYLESAKLEILGTFKPLELFQNFESVTFSAILKFMSDSAATFKGLVGIGAHTPIHIGYQVEGKFDYLDRIEFEVIKQDANKLEFKVNLPDNVIITNKIYGDMFNYDDFNGNVRQVRPIGYTAVSQESKRKRKICHSENESLGLKVCFAFPPEPEVGILPYEYEMTVEKSNPELKGYNIQVLGNSNDKSTSFELIASTVGWNSERQLWGKLNIERDLKVFNLSIGANNHGENIVIDASLALNDDSVLVHGFVANFLEFDGDVQYGNPKDHKIHIFIDIEPVNLAITIDSETTDDENIFEQNTTSVLKYKKLKSIVKCESITILDKNERILMTTSSLVKNEELMSKFKLDMQLADNWLNGQSSAKMELNERGRIFTGSLNETISNKNSVIDSKFNLEVQTPESVNSAPLHFIWDFNMDNNVKDSKVYKSQGYIWSDKKLTGAGMFNFELNKEINWSLTQKTQYEASISSNFTMKDILRQTDAKFYAYEDSQTKSGIVTIKGFTKDAQFRDDFDNLLVYSGKLKANDINKQNITYTVDRTELATGNSRNLLGGTINKTIFFENIMNFETTEKGYLIFNVDKSQSEVYDWSEFVKFHLNEFRLFKAVNNSKFIDGKKVNQFEYLIDILAKIVVVKNHTEIQVRSRHNTGQCLISNFNFTLA